MLEPPRRAQPAVRTNDSIRAPQVRLVAETACRPLISES